MACSARYSWTKPMMAFSTTMAPITIASVTSSISTVTSIAISNTTIIVSKNWLTKIRHSGVVGSSSRSLEPNSSRRRATSSVVSPVAGSTSSAAAASSAGSAHHGDVGRLATRVIGRSLRTT